MRYLMALGVLLVFAACQSADEEDTEDSATSTPSATIDDGSAPPSEDTAGLISYLIATIQIDTEITHASADLTDAFIEPYEGEAFPVEQVVAFERSLVETLDQGIEELEDVDPPADLASAHEDQMDSLLLARELLNDLALAIESGDQEAMAAACANLANNLLPLAVSAEGLMSALEEALAADGLDEMDQYFIAVGDAKIAFAAEAEGPLRQLQAAKTSTQFLEASDRVIDEMEEQMEDLQSIRPPAELSAHHLDELELLSSSIDVQNEFRSAIEGGSAEALSEANLSVLKLSNQSSRLSVRRNAFLLSQLESIPTPTPSP